LALQLEALGVVAQLKWPNDVLVGGRKLAGILPRLRLRGEQVRWAQVGLGLNGINLPPSGAISLAQALVQGPFHHSSYRRSYSRSHRPFHPKAKPQRLLKPVLAALGWAQGMAHQPERVRLEAEARLHRPAEGLLHGGHIWQVVGLESDGGLRLQRPGATFILQRSF
jgi:BirA family biotin operon repressor/biotin-[acetyl-CoA-carboxylase] ligase